MAGVITQSSCDAQLILASTAQIKATITEPLHRPVFILSIQEYDVSFDLGDNRKIKHLHVTLRDDPTEKDRFAAVLPGCLDFLKTGISKKNARVLVHETPGMSQYTSVVIAFLRYYHGSSWEGALEEIQDLYHHVTIPNAGFREMLAEMDKKDVEKCYASALEESRRVLEQYKYWVNDGGVFVEMSCDKHNHDPQCRTCRYLTVCWTFDLRRFHGLIAAGIAGHKCSHCPPGKPHNPECYTCRELTLRWHSHVKLDNPNLNMRNFECRQNCKVWHKHPYE